ncbi:MAG TPA: hypothetical protein VGC88_10775 [Terriglobales bacterium]|jgi:hypothetical protein
MVKALVLILLLLTGCAFAQRGQTRRDPLNEKEVDEMREVRDQPDKRIKLMVGFLQKRSQMLDDMLKKESAIKPSERGQQTHDLLEDITNLLDEFDDNVEMFLRETADIRKPLKEALPVEATLQKQMETLKASEANKPWFPDYSFQLTDATEAVSQTLKSTQDAIKDDEDLLKAAKEKQKQLDKQRDKY